MEYLRISNFRRRSLWVAAFGVILLMTSASVMATQAGVAPALPGDTVLPGDTSTDNPGTLVAFLAPQPFTSTNGAGSGSITSAVFREADGFLDFYYQLTNTGGGTNTDVTSVSGVDFTGFSTFVPFGLGFRADASTLCATPGPGGTCTANGGNSPFASNGSVAPTFAQRNGDGVTVTFQFNAPNAIHPGQTSNVLVVSTDATNWTFGAASEISGGVASVLSFEPSSGVPEPASLALIGSGLLLLAGFRKYAKR